MYYSNFPGGSQEIHEILCRDGQTKSCARDLPNTRWSANHYTQSFNVDANDTHDTSVMMDDSRTISFDLLSSRLLATGYI
jgi:hypothetical protein